MSTKQTYEEKINDIIDRIGDESIRSCMKICAKNRKYPKDCITDGSLEIMAKEILALEEAAAKYEGLLK